MESKMAIKLDPKTIEQAWESLVSTMGDGAIAYWARYIVDAWGEIRIAELDESGDAIATHMFTKRKMADGIESILGGEVQVREDIRSAIYTYTVDEEGDYPYDQEMVDVIVQVACFGEIVYG